MIPGQMTDDVVRTDLPSSIYRQQLSALNPKYSHPELVTSVSLRRNRQQDGGPSLAFAEALRESNVTFQAGSAFPIDKHAPASIRAFISSLPDAATPSKGRE